MVECVYGARSLPPSSLILVLSLLSSLEVRTRGAVFAHAMMRLEAALQHVVDSKGRSHVTPAVDLPLLVLMACVHGGREELPAPSIAVGESLWLLLVDMVVAGEMNSFLPMVALSVVWRDLAVPVVSLSGKTLTEERLSMCRDVLTSMTHSAFVMCASQDVMIPQLHSSIDLTCMWVMTVPGARTSPFQSGILIGALTLLPRSSRGKDYLF